MRSTPLSVVAAAALLVAGCASGGTRTVDLSYTPSSSSSVSGTSTSGGPKSVALATFVDAREKTDRIGLTKATSGDVVYVAKGGSLAEAVTEAVAARLRAAGYMVTRLGRPWDPRRGDIPSAGADVVVGGLIEEFYAENDGNAIWTPADAAVRLRVAVASPKEQRVIGQSIIRSNLDGTTTSGSLGSNLRERFIAAVEQVTLAPGLGSTLSGAR